MDVISDINKIKKITEDLVKNGKTIGFIPTMGALHEGHMALIKKSKTINDITVVSIFVNPKQFGPNEDLKKYPRPIENDKALLIKEKVDYLFYPSLNQIYPPGYKTNITVEYISNILEGKSRPGHFSGVATVVLKLFNIIKPTNAYFGQKDFQQCVVIKQMTRDLNLPINVIMVPTVRDKNGLALSSRNIYLNAQEKSDAAALYQSLQLAVRLIKIGNKNVQIIKTAMKNYIKKYKSIKLDFIEVCDLNLFPLKKIKKDMVVLIEAYVGNTRLIDNIVI